MARLTRQAYSRDDPTVPAESQSNHRGLPGLPFLSLLRKLWPFLRRARRRLWIAGVGTLLLRFTGDARIVQRIVTNGVVQLSQDVLLGCGVLLAMAVLDWRMTLGVVAILPVYVAIFWRLNPKLRHESRATRRRRSR